MLSWWIFGLLAYTSYGLSTSIDKYVMREKYYPLVVNTIKMLFDGLVLLLFGIFFFKPEIPSPEQLWPLLILGALYGASGVYYFKSLQAGDVTEVVPYQLGLRITLTFFLSLLLFREEASPLNLFGLILIILGGWFLLSPNNSKIPRWSLGVKLMSMSLLFGVLHNLLAKRLVSGLPPITVGIVMYFVTFLLLSTYLALRKSRWYAAEKTLSERGLAKIALAALFGGAGTFLLFSALALGAASKIYAMSVFEVLILLVIGALFFKERISWKRLLGALCVGAGILLVIL